jgi:hypothetical protein
MADDVVEIVEEEEEEKAVAPKKTRAAAAAAPAKKLKKKPAAKKLKHSPTAAAAAAAPLTTEQLHAKHVSAAKAASEARRALNSAVILGYVVKTADEVFTDRFNIFLAKTNAWFHGLKTNGNILLCHLAAYKTFKNYNEDADGGGGGDNDELCLFSLQDYAVWGTLFRNPYCQLNNGVDINLYVRSKEEEDDADLYSLPGFGTLCSIIGCEASDFGVDQFRYFSNYFTATLFTFLKGLAVYLKENHSATNFIDPSVLDSVFATFVFKQKFGFTMDDE